MELTDYLGKTHKDACYQVADSMNYSRANLKKKIAKEGIAPLLGKFFDKASEMCVIKKLSDLDAGEFKEREFQRPPGYSANTRVHLARLCMALLVDSGATCACMSEEMAVLLINHVYKMVEEGKLDENSYNYPLRHMYRYKNVATLRGAEAKGRMSCRYGMLLRIEFIPEGRQTGPCKDIYFKIFDQGTCAVVGGVIGWPQMDLPHRNHAEGLGFRQHDHSFEFQALNVHLPRLDDHRKDGYLSSLATYEASNGAFMAIDDVTKESIKLISDSDARDLRMASLLASQVPTARMEPIGIEEFILQPGERAVLPVQ